MVSYGKILREKGIERDNSRYEKVGFYYSQSNIGGCDRELYLQATGQWSFDPDATLAGIFEDGEAHEELTGEQLRTAGIEILETQVPSSIALPDHPLILSSNRIAGVGFRDCPVCNCTLFGACLHGHMDFIVRNPETGEPEVIEHKAIAKDWWLSTVSILRQENGGEDFFRAHKRYIVQTGLYLADLADRYNLNTASGVLMFKNKNDAAFLEARLVYNPWNDTLALVSADIEGNRVLDESRGYAVSGFFDQVVGKILRLEKAVVEEPFRHALSQGTKCPNCHAKSACEEMFDLQITEEHEDRTLLLADDAVSSKIERWKELQGQVSVLEKAIKPLKSELGNLAKLAAEKGAGPGVAILSKDHGLVLGLRSWSMTTIDQAKLKELPEDEQEIVKKVLVRKSGFYPTVTRPNKVIKSILKKSEGRLDPLQLLIDSGDEEKPPAANAHRRFPGRAASIAP